MSDHDAIAKRAYELYLERGSTPGYEVEDWLAAEAELTAAAAEAAEEQTEESVEGKRAPSVSAGKRGGRRESQTNSRRALRP